MNNPLQAPSQSNRRPVAGPAAWTSEKIEKNDAWQLTLSTAEIAELDAAVNAVVAGGADLRQVDMAQFPLPQLGPKLRRIRDQVMEGIGFALLKGIPVERYDRRQAVTAFWGLGRWLGKPVPQNGKGHLLGHVYDLGYDPKDAAVRIYQTTRRQTFHTDSVDIVMLLCLQAAKNGGESSLVSSMAIHDEMLAQRPDLLDMLYQPFSTDRRGEVPEGQKPWFDLPVYNDYENFVSAIYARQYIKSAQRFDAVPRLTDVQIEALDYFDALAEDPKFRIDMMMAKGDLQIVCNHVLLHDRGDYEDWPEPARKRHLLRLWLCPPEARPLPPAYAARYGSVTIGDRGGIRVKGSDTNIPMNPE